MAKYLITRIDGEKGARLFPPPATPMKEQEPAVWQMVSAAKYERDLDLAELSELNSRYEGYDEEYPEEELVYGSEAPGGKIFGLGRAAFALILAFALLFSLAVGYLSRGGGVDLSFLSQSGWLSKDPLIKELRESVVRVETATGFGSGFNISPQGLIVTNCHVIEGSNSPQITFRRGMTVSARNIKRFPEADLAFLSLSAKNLPYAKVAEEDLRVGEKVVYIGNPLGFNWTVIEATVIYVGLNEDGVKIVVLSGPVYAGASGSPVFNAQGQVAAIIYAQLQNSTLDGLAIAASELRARLP